MSFEPYTDREFLSDCHNDICSRLDQLAALLQQLIDAVTKGKANG